MRRINYIRLGVAVMIAITASFYYCSKTEKNPVEKDLQQNSSVNFLLAGKWKLTEVISPGAYGLKDFTGFHFTFTSNAVIYASRDDGNTFRGTWSMGKDNMERTKLYINFGDQAILNELNNDWLVTELSSNTLKLSFATGTNENGGSNGTPTTERFFNQRLTFVTEIGVSSSSPQNTNPN